MLIFQELSGESLYQLCTTEALPELSGIWQELDYVVLIGSFRFDAENKLHFEYKNSAIDNCETYLELLRKMKRKCKFNLC